MDKKANSWCSTEVDTHTIHSYRSDFPIHSYNSSCSDAIAPIHYSPKRSADPRLLPIASAWIAQPTDVLACPFEHPYCKMPTPQQKMTRKIKPLRDEKSDKKGFF
jgi:hypothetical protein